MNHFDIKVKSPEAREIGVIDSLVAEEFRKMARAKEKSLRELAAPYLKAGYLPSELTAVERVSEWFLDGEHVYVCVKIGHERSALRLWWRRTMTRLGLRGAQYQCEVLPWRR